MNVAIIYHQFPHYRAPVIRELALRGRHDYVFYGSEKDFDGIKAFKGDEAVAVSFLDVTRTKRGFRFKNYLHIATSKSTEVLVILGNPNIFATWVLAILGRMNGKKVVFWAHGWLAQESLHKRWLRRMYYQLSHSMLVYGDRSKTIGVSQGYNPDRVRVVYNSLDYETSTRIFEQIESGADGGVSCARQLFGDPLRPLIICTARLTELCRFDVLLQAAHQLGRMGLEVNVLLVGDGPSRHELERLALQLELSVHFYGACYDEDVLGRLIYDADATVSPGKIGLTAIHSLSYGTPAFTHGDMDRQMPEVEAITPGVTGDFFCRNSVDDLAFVLKRWFESGNDRAQVRRECRSIVSQRWNPAKQRELIESALDSIGGGA